MRGKQAILEYWTNVAQTQQDIQFGYQILAVTPEHGIARWWASLVIVPPGLQTKLYGIFSSPWTKIAAAIPSASGGTSNKLDRAARVTKIPDCLLRFGSSADYWDAGICS